MFPTIEKLNTGTKKSEWYVKKHYLDFFDYLANNFDFCESHIERLYCYYNNITEKPACPVCKKPLKFLGTFNSGYQGHCSLKCSNSDELKKEKCKQTCLERYGVDNISKTDQYKEKYKQTCLERYGVDCPSRNTSIREKMKQTCLERYGVDNFSKTNECREKSKQTCLERYGVEHTSKTEQYKEKYKQTCLERYGVEHISKTSQYKEKCKQTNLERHGVEWQISSSKTREKTKQTCLERYGVEYNFQAPEIKEKIKQTCLERYGVDNPFKKEGFWIENCEKIKQTCLERYGVEYYCLTDECKGNTNDSKPNLEFEKLLKDNNIEYEREFIIKNRAYDFKVGNNLIEINPFPTHNSTWGLFNNPKDKSYHHEKMKLAKDNGYNCISIWDWDEYGNIIGLLMNKTSIGARNCEIKEVDKKCCKEFLNKNHLQGDCRNQSIRLGLYYGDELIELMTFGKPRYNKNYEYELLRLCTKRGLVVNGGASKLFKHFIKNYNATSIISYCDLSKFSGKIYEDLGFTHKSTSISKHWYEPKTNTHITDNLLKQRGFDQLFKTNYGKGVSNKELMLEHGFVEIFDCGQSTYVYNSI